jgi:hypothetical protein
MDRISGSRTFTDRFGQVTQVEFTAEGPATAAHHDPTLGPFEQQMRVYANIVNAAGEMFRVSINRNFLTGEIGDIHLSSH